MAFEDLEVGAIVRCAAEPDWGLGQIQSMINGVITVNFENAGKQVFMARGAAPDALELVRPERPMSS